MRATFTMRRIVCTLGKLWRILLDGNTYQLCDIIWSNRRWVLTRGESERSKLTCRSSFSSKEHNAWIQFLLFRRSHAFDRKVPLDNTYWGSDVNPPDWITHINDAKDIQSLALIDDTTVKGVNWSRETKHTLYSCRRCKGFGNTLISTKILIDMHTHLDLHIKHGICVDSQTERDLNMVSQSFLVALLNGSPFITECFVFSEREEAFEHIEFLKPDTFVGFESLRDQCTKLGVALWYSSRMGRQMVVHEIHLVKPPARRN